MQIRPKTIRRLLALFSVALLIVGGLAAWLLVSQRRIAAQTAQSRVEAVAAYNAHDYANAVRLLSDYLTRSHSQDTDVEAVYDYAKSRLETPLDGNRQVYEAIGLFERYLQLDAKDSRDASHTLLKLYAQARYNKEGRALADRLLASNPKDIAALRALVQCLRGDQNFAGALQACQRLNALDPDNLEWQIAELDLMSRMGTPAAQILTHTRELRDAHPENSTFVATWAIALFDSHDETAARSALQDAAKLPPGKPENVLQIVRLLDMSQMFDLSDSLLDKAISAQPTSLELSRLAARRGWERSGPQAVIDRFQNLNAENADSTILGYLALSEFQSNQADAGRKLLAALSRRIDDPARSWTIILQTAYPTEQIPPARAIKNFTNAAIRDPANPVVYLFLGQTYANIGEADAAIRQWTTDTELSPSWAVPFGLISRTESAKGQFADALRDADAARQRAPGSQLAETVYAVAWYGLASQHPAVPNSKDSKALTQLFAAIQTSWPNEPTTLPLYIANLARDGRQTDAISTIATAISSPSVPLATLLHLAAVSHEQKLNQESAILDAAERRFGVQPATAAARAALLPPAKVMAAFDATAAGHPNDIAWQIAAARLADSVGDASALKRWITIGDAQPTNLDVQSSILSSPSRRLDSSFWRRTIDRFKSIDGADGQLVQLENARLKLAGPLSDAEAMTLASSLQRLTSMVPNDATSHQLLAQVYLKSKSPDHLARAGNELQRAHDLRPGDFETTAELIEVLIAQGQTSPATALADGLGRDAQLTSSQKQWVADVDSRLGRAEAGVALLQGEPSTPQHDMLLARLEQQCGKADEAAAIYRRMLSDSNASADGLVGAAEFFARSGDAETAKQFVSRLKKLPLQAGAGAIIDAHVDQLLGKPDDAIAVLSAAANLTPNAEQIWQEIAGLELRTGRRSEAEETIRQGLRANPSSQSLAAMQTQIGRIRSLTSDEIRPLLDVICHQPTLPTLDQTLKILSNKSTPEETLAALRALSDQHPDFVPLQELLAAQYASAGRLKEAAEMASRAASVAVNDPAPIRLLCAIQTAAGDWDGVHRSALRWRAMTPLAVFEPDMALARGYLNQSHPDAAAAVHQLDPYVADTADAKIRNQALPLYAAALISAGQPDKASSLLKPLLGDAHWRMVWLDLASSLLKDRDTAFAWIHECQSHVASDSATEQIALADAWEKIGSRLNAADAHAAAMHILKPIVEGPNPPAGAWATWASVNQSSNDLAEAEHGWRQFLALQPNQALGKNNLAYILLLEGGTDRLNEAEKLCNDAIALQPGISGFYDTLARVKLAKGQTDDAKNQFHAALSHDPNNVEAMIGLADLLQSSNSNAEELKGLMIRINAGLRSGTPLAPPIRQQLDRVKNALTSSM